MDPEVTFVSEQRLTQEEFFVWRERRPPSDHHRYELIQGRIVMTPPADFRHATLDTWLGHRLWRHVDEHELGFVLGSSGTYDMPSGDTLEPDVAFVSHARLEGGPPPVAGRNIRIVPDLVIEVLSKSTQARDRGVKKEIYAANGVREYWLVDPRRRTVTVFQARDHVFDAGRTLAAGVLPSVALRRLELTVEEVFRHT